MRLIREWGLWLSPAVLMAVLFAGGEAWGLALSFQPEAIGRGQWWRLVTGHYVHFTAYHTVINALGCALVSAFLFKDDRLWAWGGALVVLPLVISLGFLAEAGAIDEYRGFSGALYGLLILGLLLNVHEQPWLYGSVALALVGKIVYEQMPGYDVLYLEDRIGVPVAVNAHLYGVVGGIAMGLIGLVGRVIQATKNANRKA